VRLGGLWVLVYKAPSPNGLGLHFSSSRLYRLLSSLLWGLGVGPLDLYLVPWTLVCCAFSWALGFMLWTFHVGHDVPSWMLACVFGFFNLYWSFSGAWDFCFIRFYLFFLWVWVLSLEMKKLDGTTLVGSWRSSTWSLVPGWWSLWLLTFDFYLNSWTSTYSLHTHYVLPLFSVGKYRKEQANLCCWGW
jgi:hypothetical protein